jgi:hypothetical protein
VKAAMERRLAAAPARMKLRSKKSPASGSLWTSMEWLQV